MDTFHHAVALRMVGGGPQRLDAQELVHLRPKTACELSALVRCYVPRDAETRDPRPEESCSTILRSHHGQGNGLQPPGVPVHYREKVLISFGHGKGTNQVHVE